MTDHPDAALLTACEEFNVIARAVLNVYSVAKAKGATVSDEQLDRLHDLEKSALDKIVAQRARTIEGVRAKAMSFVLWHGEALELGQYWDEHFRGSILGDLLGVDVSDDGAVQDVCSRLAAGQFESSCGLGPVA